MNPLLPPLDLDHLRQWTGRSETREDLMHTAIVNAMAATLDRDEHFREGDALPHLWHWLFFWAVSPASVAAARATPSSRHRCATSSQGVQPKKAVGWRHCAGVMPSSRLASASSGRPHSASAWPCWNQASASSGARAHRRLGGEQAHLRAGGRAARAPAGPQRQGRAGHARRIVAAPP